MESALSNPDTRLLPAGWHQHYDPDRHTWYYVQINVLPPKVSYTHPANLSETPPSHSSAAPVPPIDPAAEMAPSSHKNRPASSPRLSPAQLLYANAISKRKILAGGTSPPSDSTSINVGSDSESPDPSSDQPPLSSSTSQSSFFQSNDDQRPIIPAESSNSNVISPRLGSKRRSKLSTRLLPTANTLRSVPDAEPAEQPHNTEVLDPLPLDQMNKFNKVKIAKPTRPGEAPTILMTAIPPEQERSSRDPFTLPQPHVNTSSSTQRSGPSHDAHFSPSSSRPLPQPKPTTINQQQEPRHIHRPSGSVGATATSNIQQPRPTLPRTPTQAWDLSDNPNVPLHAAYPANPTQQHQQQTHHHGSHTNQPQPARSSNVNATQQIDRPSHQTTQSLARLPMSLERPLQDQITPSGLQQSGSQNRPLLHSLPRQENASIPTRSSSLDLASAYQQPPSRWMPGHGQPSTVAQRRSSIQRSHSYHQATHQGDQVDMGQRPQQQQYSHDHRQAMVTATAQGHSQPQQHNQQHSASYNHSGPDAHHDRPLVEQQVTVGPFHAMQHGDFDNQDYVRRPGIGRRGFVPPE